MDAIVDDGRLPGAPNGDEVGFVSLNEAGDQSGSFHPSESKTRRIVARSMKPAMAKGLEENWLAELHQWSKSQKQ